MILVSRIITPEVRAFETLPTPYSSMQWCLVSAVMKQLNQLSAHCDLRPMTPLEMGQLLDEVAECEVVHTVFYDPALDEVPSATYGMNRLDQVYNSPIAWISKDIADTACLAVATASRDVKHVRSNLEQEMIDMLPRLAGRQES